MMLQYIQHRAPSADVFSAASLRTALNNNLKTNSSTVASESLLHWKRTFGSGDGLAFEICRNASGSGEPPSSEPPAREDAHLKVVSSVRSERRKHRGSAWPRERCHGCISRGA